LAGESFPKIQEYNHFMNTRLLRGLNFFTVIFTVKRSKWQDNAIIFDMRSLRVLRQGVWYEVYTRINNREPLFRRGKALALFGRVFWETAERFAFEVRRLRLEDDWLRFYIKPADGFELPGILKWLKQTFAQRYNRAAGRIGHLWGDRYGSRIVEGEPGGEVAGEGKNSSIPGVRPLWGEEAEKFVFPTFFPLPVAPAPG
jgi:REP element-mobilizing transposase RayT